MRNLLIQRETLSPVHPQMGCAPGKNSARMLGLAVSLDRKQRYERMVERFYGNPGAANHLLLKTLCLSAMAPSNETDLLKV